jgi:hypothetical protein
VCRTSGSYDTHHERRVVPATALLNFDNAVALTGPRALQVSFRLSRPENSIYSISSGLHHTSELRFPFVQTRHLRLQRNVRQLYLKYARDKLSPSTLQRCQLLSNTRLRAASAEDTPTHAGHTPASSSSPDSGQWSAPSAPPGSSLLS